MSERLYPLYCFHTGRVVHEGTEQDLRDHYNAMGAGEPFDENGHLRFPQPAASTQRLEPQPAQQIALALVKA